MSEELLKQMLNLKIPVFLMPIHHNEDNKIEYIEEKNLPPTNPSHEKYIIAYNNKIDSDKKTDKLDNIPGFKSKHKLKHAINGCAATINKGLLSQLLDDPDILYIEKDSLIYENGYNKERVPEGDKQAGLWHQVMVNSHPIATEDYSRIHCYILDSGILSNHNEFVSGQVILDYNSITKNNKASDDNGHGTAVASVISGKTVGILNKVTLHSIKVLNSSGTGYVSDTIAGLNWVLANKKEPCIINMSLGGNFSSMLNTAVQNCIIKNIQIVCASGNDGIDASDVSPANSAGVITVSACDNMKMKPSWSNYGSVVSTFAPGVSVRAAWGDYASSYFLVSGTSFSSPITCGVICKYLKEKPNATPSEIKGFLSRINLNGEIINVGSGVTPNKRVVWNKDKINEC